MAYIKTNWVNGQTPINATNLNKIESGIYNVYNDLFPVGSIIIRDDNTDYSNWLGFTWEKVFAGKVLVGVDTSQTEFNTIGQTGGEKTHKLVENELPKLSGQISMHSASVATNINGVSGKFSSGHTNSSSYRDGGTTGSGASSVGIINLNIGNDQSHNNLQPYQVVAYWKRTA